MKKKLKENPVIAKNPAAQRDFKILETVEAGIVLQGSEVKSLRAREAQLRGAFARIDGGELVLYGMEISPYPQAGHTAPDPQRPRKLLLHKRELVRLSNHVATQGATLVALRVYLKGNYVKVELGLGKGKKAFEKRETIKKRESDREIDRAVKHRNR